MDGVSQKIISFADASPRSKGVKEEEGSILPRLRARTSDVSFARRSVQSKELRTSISTSDQDTRFESVGVGKYNLRAATGVSDDPKKHHTESSGVNNDKPVKKKRFTESQRRRARNSSERQRQHVLNEAFDEIRNKIPEYYKETPSRKLTKVSTLGKAMLYISDLTETLEQDDLAKALEQGGNSYMNREARFTGYE